MISAGERVFVDTGAWVALAVVRDPLHGRARGHWDSLSRLGARLVTSIPVVLETFTYLDRKGSRELALAWRDSLSAVRRFQVLECTSGDVQASWHFFDRKQFHKLSLVDATSFTLMRRHRIRVALAFDTHFSIAGFRYAE
ncbi:MAG: type II toxin-antitoxin system VapC family toxin [Myxococcaceae bacterium]